MEHNIFLSHSGEQKGFARDLCNRLRSQGHNPFFDENPDSLPPGEQFPPLIFSAVDNCKLALIVLSNDFLSSRWPMMELCAAFDRLSNNRSDPSFTILPLFFKLSPADIKENSKVTEWRKKWMEFEQISHGRITASKCEEVVTKTLPRLNGVVRRAESVQGESSYIDEIVNRISSILLPDNHLRLRYGVDPHKHYVGRERLCKVIEHEFRVLEMVRVLENKSSSQIIFLGMYGVPGSGKSTICDFMRDYLRDFDFMAIHLTLPTDLSAEDALKVKEQYFKLMSVLFPLRKRDFKGMNLEELYNQLQLGSTSRHKIFLVLDNISPSNYAIYKVMIQAILSSNALGHGSWVKVVAQSSAILEKLFMECEHNHSINHSITKVPSLTTEEAKELMRNQYSSIKDDLVTRLLKKCTFSFMFIPFVFEQIGILLRERRCNDFEEKELEQFWKIVEKGKKDAVKTLVDMNFNQLPQDLKDLFFDIALLIIPAGHSKLTDAIPILCRIHNITDAFDIKCKIEDLRKHCTLSVVGGELRMHDIFKEYARSNPGISEIYVNQPSLNISNLLVDNDQYLHPRRIDLKFPVARAICIGTCERSIDCQRNDEEVCLHVEVGCTARALLVRNRSEYSRCILVLSGDVSSLVCLQTENVQQVAFRSSTLGEGDVNLSNLVRLELENKLKLRAEDIMKEENSGSKISSFLDKSREWISWLWKPMESYLPRRYEQRMSNFVFSTRQMTCLRVLRLIDVDIGRIEIVGSPVLEEIEIRKDVQYPMDVSIHRTSKLKRLVIQGSDYWDTWHRIIQRSDHWASDNWGSDRWYDTWHRRRYYRSSVIQGNARKLELGLSDCVELEEVILDRSFHGVKVVGLLPKKLRDLTIVSYGSGNKEWIGSSIHQLSALENLHLSWGSLRINRLSFTQKSFGCLRALKRMRLEQCESLTHLTLEPSCLPNLIELTVRHCEKLQVLEGLEHIIWMGQMEELRLDDLPQLEECDLSRWNNCSLCEGSWDSPQLEEIKIRDCPNVKIYFDGLEAYKHLRVIWMEGAGGISTAQKKVKKQYDVALKEEEDGSSADGCIKIANMKEEEGANMLVDNCKCCSNVEESTIVASSSSSSSSPTTALMLFSEGKFTSLSILVLSDIDHLREIEGIHHLPELEYLVLRNLPNLTRVSGTWPASIRRIEFDNCPILLEIPPFEQTLPNLWILKCERCTALKAVEVEGCSLGEMESLKGIRFTECESMEVFPIEGEQSIEVMGDDDKQWWRKRREEYPARWPENEETRYMSVYGSKFARREATERWLRDSELGSPLFEAAVEALLWEHYRKGIPGALDALHHYFSSLVDTITSSHAADDLHEYLYRVFYESGYRFFYYLDDFNVKWIKYKEFQEWMLQKFPQLSSHIKNSRLEDSSDDDIYDDESEDDDDDDEMPVP